MTILVRRFTALLFCLVGLALPATAHGASDARLLAKHQPVTKFDSVDSFRPTSVETFIADSTLERFNPFTGTFVLVDPSPSPATLPTSGAGWRLNQQPCVPSASIGGLACYLASWRAHDAPHVVYGRVARLPTRIVLQYWYFYYDNTYSYTHVPTDFIWQAHEGDWEVVNVVLDSTDAAPYSLVTANTASASAAGGHGLSAGAGRIRSFT